MVKVGDPGEKQPHNSLTVLYGSGIQIKFLLKVWNMPYKSLSVGYNPEQKLFKLEE